MLNQVFAARAIGQHGGLQLARHVQLVVARKDDALDLFFPIAHGNQVTAQNLQPAVTRPHLLPQVGRTVAASRVDRVARCAIVAQVEGQEHSGRAVQPGDHRHFLVAHRKMHQRTVRKTQQRLGQLPLVARVAVKAVLVNRIANALGKVRFQLHRGHRQAVEEQYQVDAVLVVQRVAHLAHHAQAVGGVAGQYVGVDRQGRFELGQLQRCAQTQQLNAVAQHVQRATLV